jgi:hypothetical protein
LTNGNLGKKVSCVEPLKSGKKGSVKDDNNVPQQGHHEFVRVHTSHVDLDAPVSQSSTITKAAVSLDDPQSLGLPWKAGVVWIL